MKKISEEKKNNIVNLLEKGIPARQIARQLQFDEKTVRKIRDEVCTAAKKSKGGRPAKISEATTRRIQRAVTSGKANTATEVARQLCNDAIANVHPITVRRALRRVGLVARKKIKKPRFQDRYKKLRLEFAKKHASWTVEDWSRVIWSDETKINRLGSDGCKWVWKKQGARQLTDRKIEGTVKFGGGSLMVWGCFTAKGVGYMTKIEGSLNAELYTKILDDEFLQTLEYYGYKKEEIIFQQDNDPKHTSRLAKKWFKENEVKVLEWPPQSPYLNPIEHLWVKLKRRLNSYEEEPKSIYELWERVQDTWNDIGAATCERLVGSMPSRVAAVLEAKGGYTKY